MSVAKLTAPALRRRLFDCFMERDGGAFSPTVEGFDKGGA
jgi:hypothetical protein